MRPPGMLSIGFVAAAVVLAAVAVTWWRKPAAAAEWTNGPMPNLMELPPETLQRQPPAPTVTLPPSGVPRVPTHEELEVMCGHLDPTSSVYGRCMAQFNESWATDKPEYLDGQHYEAAVGLWRTQYGSKRPVVVLREGSGQTVTFDPSYLYLFVDAEGTVTDAFNYTRVEGFVTHNGLVKVYPKSS